MLGHVEIIKLNATWQCCELCVGVFENLIPFGDAFAV